ncbi:MAG: peptidylprolyl isomerase [Candidatus Krumholzibacteria bacterium]|jgi:peptidyl-prolyl cis-trans isomerase B (cyclophilin B)|nr:peptidylprolyl isomerase [Candidatus Krumholzibacteria bacterium]MDP6797176.1 peptidylprolyl isomerase [Candidatus Krumholzibacteria bacterium]MDP7021479.1 peptidylprolyl isomerase [Candidatus Krumholzibacteria bacterium]
MFSRLILILSLFVAVLPLAAEEATETVVILETEQGDIALRFFPDLAPEHVKNFIHHAKEGNYTSTYFHRVIPNFMIQGGDFNTKNDNPKDDGMGGWSYKGEGTNLPAEFSDRAHKRGILSMARSQNPNSAGSQFFLMHADAPFLDGKYTVFGETVDGIEVVDKIVNANRDQRDRPLKNQFVHEVQVEEWKTSVVEEAKKTMWAEDRSAGKGK